MDLSFLGTINFFPKSAANTSLAGFKVLDDHITKHYWFSVLLLQIQI
jgi:hypothetical protein